MRFEIFKYQGTGNDFVIIDNREQLFDAKDHSLIQKICDRRFGVGGDGFMLLQNSEDYDFEMVYFNADGHEGTMCGNGGRCLVRFAYDLGVIGEKTTFIAVDGEHEASVKDGLVELKMKDLESYELNSEDAFMDTGSPHYVGFVDDVNAFDVVKEGRKVRLSDRFSPEGTNVNFVEELSPGMLSVRTFERGVEDETLSCGTGVTASVITYALRKKQESPVKVNVLGGELSVLFRNEEGKFRDVYLVGPAEYVFKGEIDLSILKN